MRAAHEFLSARSRAFTESLAIRKARLRQVGGVAAAAADGGSLRVLAHGRRHSPALRPYSTWWYPLVRSARRLQNRNSWAGQSAAGEERHNRPRRSQGRLLSQAASGKRNARSRPAGGNRSL